MSKNSFYDEIIISELDRLNVVLEDLNENDFLEILINHSEKDDSKLSKIEDLFKKLKTNEIIDFKMRNIYTKDKINNKDTCVTLVYIMEKDNVYLKLFKLDEFEPTQEKVEECIKEYRFSWKNKIISTSAKIILNIYNAWNTEMPYQAWHMAGLVFSIENMALTHIKLCYNDEWLDDYDIRLYNIRNIHYNEEKEELTVVYKNKESKFIKLSDYQEYH